MRSEHAEAKSTDTPQAKLQLLKLDRYSEMRDRLCTWTLVATITGIVLFRCELNAQDHERSPDAQLAAFDQTVLDLMTRWHLPGGQLAIAKDGRLAFDRAYGYADVALEEPVEPTSIFRIGSVSKTITAAAVLALVDEGHLKLDDRIRPILSDLTPPRNAAIDPRFDEITVQDLLQHAGGWEDFAPLELPWSRMASATIGVEGPPDCTTVFRYMLSIPLDFAPGSRTAYSNFGYCVLGLVIEQALRAAGTEMTYEQYVKNVVLGPAGVSSMRLGRTKLSDRLPDEVRYYPTPEQPLVPSVFAGEGYVPYAYGGFYLEASGPAGGWVGSASDLVRFALSLDGTRGSALLRPDTYRRMLETRVPGTNGTQTGLCWTVAKREDGYDIWHAGGLKDSHAAWLVRTASGVTLAFAFNSLPAKHHEFFGEVLPTFLDLIRAQEHWPDVDLFDPK